MSDNIIRHDIIKLDFETGNCFTEIKKLQNEINELKKKLTAAIDNGAFDDLKDSAEKSVSPLKKVKEQADKVKESVTNIGKKAAVTAFNGLKKLAGISLKGLATGVTAAAGAIGGLVAKSTSAYAEFEQLKGGVKTLFKGSADTVMEYASEAYKSAGLSSNAYMETVTGFSASLLQATGRGAQTDLEQLKGNLDKQYETTKETQTKEYNELKRSWTEKINLAKKNGATNIEELKAQRDKELEDLKAANKRALNELKGANEDRLKEAETANNVSKQTAKSQAEAAKLANQAVVDMSDNANKMGTDMASIQYAYQGFAKQNYTMLDNLNENKFRGIAA